MPTTYKPKLVKAEKSGDCHEILVHGPIGKSFWSDEGISGKDFTDALNEIPAGEKVVIGVNSQGGSVGEGLAIFNAIARRSSDVTCRIDGYAISIASVFPLAACKVVSPKSSIWMIHNAWSVAQGNADEMRDAADMLDKHDDVIVSVYAKKTGKPESEIRKAMSEETWLSGEEAVDWKLADEGCDPNKEEGMMDSLDFSGASPNAFRRIPSNAKGLLAAVAAFDISRAGLVPGAAGQSPKISAGIGGAQKKDQDTMREKLVALLKKHGIEIPKDATDEQIVALADKIPTAQAATPPPAAPAPTAPAADSAIVDIRAELKAMRDERDAERKASVTAKIDALIANCQVTAAEREKAIFRATADASYLDELAARPAVQAGAEPINSAIVVEDDYRSISKAISALWGKGPMDAEATLARGRQRASIIAANRKRIIETWNASVSTNTVATDLKRTVILQDMIRAFAIKTLPLGAFSTVFNGIRLEGTDKIAVPYWPLDTTASIDFNSTNGYDTFTNSNADAKTITVDKRKYQALNWNSSELARQPYFNSAMSMMLKSEQLGIDCVQDVLSLVTLATFGAASSTGLADAFDSDDVADLKGVADLANWPASGRSLMLNSAYDVNLLKDASIKAAYAFGDNAPIREGRIVRLVGFDYFPDSRIPANSENLQGFICFKSALLVGFSPIGPTAEVRSQLTRYEVVIDPETGCAFEYRAWGDADKDVSREIIEANYGRVAGEAAALKRITSA